MHEDTLAHVELFAGLEKKDLQLLAGACRERKYSAGSKLIKQGDIGVGLYVLQMVLFISPGRPTQTKQN